MLRLTALLQTAEFGCGSNGLIWEAAAVLIELSPPSLGGSCVTLGIRIQQRFQFRCRRLARLALQSADVYLLSCGTRVESPSATFHPPKRGLNTIPLRWPVLFAA